jgi:hypothetical protein
MIYLCEREIGFDAAEIGFPSVHGCRAIVLVTGGGLFGYHLNGNLNPGKKSAFVNFVAGHAQGGSQKMGLYAASTGGGLKQDHDELKDVAGTLGHTGPVYWASLSTAGSVYVNFLGVGHATCGITSRAWSDAVDRVPANWAPYAPGANRAMANGAAPARMYVNASTAGLTAVYPIKI